MWLFLAFLLVPLIEIALFIQVGGLIGLLPTLAIVVLTAALGTWLVRSQGRMALGEIRGSLGAFRDPSEPLAHGAMILVAGALLLTPGFFTDAVGFALLVPAVRRAVLRQVGRRVSVTRMGMGTGEPPRAAPDGRSRRPEPPGTIDGEFTELPHGKRPTHRPPSGWTRH